jgi:hypothetical protein
VTRAEALVNFSPIAVALAVLLLLALAVQRKKRGNRRRPNVLGDPCGRCQRFPDFRSYTQQGRFW